MLAKQIHGIVFKIERIPQCKTLINIIRGTPQLSFLIQQFQKIASRKCYVPLRFCLSNTFEHFIQSCSDKIQN